jgi:hypothetical protein
MQKKFDVGYSVVDGTVPKVQHGLLYFGAPFETTIAPGEEIVIPVGVVFDVPLLLVEGSPVTMQGVRLVNVGSVVEGGVDTRARLKNEGDATAFFERGTTIVRAVPLPSNFLLCRS